MRIRIDYFEDVEETDAVHLGEFPDGSGELFRVARPSIAMGGVSREDVATTVFAAILYMVTAFQAGARGRSALKTLGG